VAQDTTLTADCDGVAGEWSLAPGSRAARMRTLTIDYWLAPEHPFPAAQEDTLAAWHFLRKQGVAAKDIVIGGDSAGGNLTIGLINQLREVREDAKLEDGRRAPARLGQFIAAHRPS